MAEESGDTYFDDITKFYKGHARKPKIFVYDNDGNGEIYKTKKSADPELIKTVIFKTYRSLTRDEINEMEEVRKEAIAKAEELLAEEAAEAAMNVEEAIEEVADAIEGEEGAA